MRTRIETVNHLEAEVYERIIDCIDSPTELKRFMEQIYGYGLQSGLVSNMIYREDCIKFLKANLEEVFEVLEDMVNECVIEAPSTNIELCAWQVFEFVTHRLYQRLEESTTTVEMTFYGEEE